MADKWMDALADLPPGTNVFDYVQQLLTSQIYADYGATFWVSLYLAAGLLGATLLAIVLGFYINIRRKGRAWFIVQDGACTHINPKAWVLGFWLLMCICLLVQIFWLHAVLVRKHEYSGRYTSFPLICGLLPVLSFAGLTLHLLTRSPTVRRALIRINAAKCGVRRYHGFGPAVIITNATLALWCLFVGLLHIIPGRVAYEAGEITGAAYSAATRVVANAKAKGDLSALGELISVITRLERVEELRLRTLDLTGWVYSPFFIFYLISTIGPAICLNVYIRGLTRDYELGLSYSSDSTVRTKYHGGTPEQARNIPDLDNRVELPKQVEPKRKITVVPSVALPRDRPFGNVVEVDPTTVAPQHMQRILDLEERPVEKAARLRKAMRRDNVMLMGYVLLLLTLGAIPFYQLTGTPKRQSPQLSYKISMLHEIWSFTLPASFVSAIFIYDAIYSINTAQDEVQRSTMQRSTRADSVSGTQPNVITLSQSVSVVEEYAMEKYEQRENSLF